VFKSIIFGMLFEIATTILLNQEDEPVFHFESMLTKEYEGSAFKVLRE
jgi:hypothetical protein